MKKLLFALITVCVVIIFLEGVSCLFLNLYYSIYAYKNFGTAEGAATETQYDRDLGWANKTNVYVENEYGQGNPLTLNAQGFRHPVDVRLDKQAGVLRIVMIGDFFVFGSENGDAATISAEVQRYNELEVRAVSVELANRI